MDDVQRARSELMRDSPAVLATMNDRLVHVKVRGRAAGEPGLCASDQAPVAL